MATPALGWTAPLRVSQLRADPSGVQDASSTVQAVLLGGMSTATGNIRYISLFAAARYFRTLLGDASNTQVGWEESLRRLEALIAVSSYRHHASDNQVPAGVIGSGAGSRMSRQHDVRLQTGLAQPPYNIYRGTMSALEIIDIDQPSDPLFEGARALAMSWQPTGGGFLVDRFRAGALPETTTQTLIDTDAHVFCLCAVPDGSEEQKTLSELVLGLGRQFQLPTFASDERADPLAYRAVSWRLVLELVALSPGRDLADTRLMARLLEPDLLHAPLPAALRTCLSCWRWVAARTFFERGWTRLFNRTLRLTKGFRDGLSSQELRGLMKEKYIGGQPEEPLARIVAEARDHIADAAWLEARYTSNQARDLLLSITAGMLAAQKDLDSAGASLLQALWSKQEIPFSEEERRLQRHLRDASTAASYWTALAERTLAEHMRIALRKMSAGNPDSLHVDFESGRWRVPEKALNWEPQESGSSSRLDIALGWAQQLGLVRKANAGLELTATGEAYRSQWDREHLE